MREQTGDTYVCQIKNQKTPWIFWFFIFPGVQLIGVVNRRQALAISDFGGLPVLLRYATLNFSHGRGYDSLPAFSHHIRKYAPLPASTKIADCKRFRSICVKLDFSSYPKNEIVERFFFSLSCLHLIGLFFLLGSLKNAK
ncbi:hypothetical protein [Listeria booriae]|uniref:hypothetical protein n=1 Tax=Listeria booriae TaxID=1552123 RepID=UPI0016243C07|nr:hypothetical protein [Listeria booriae]MBC1232732.1 hypothetical protein [Listeria booriae]MBC1248024.1 hypothetical protein [Listeria booriae]